MTAGILGACAFGAVLGYLTHFLVRRDANAGVKDLAAIVGVLLGDGVFRFLVGANEANWYMVGIGIGFFLYWAALMVLSGVAPARGGPAAAGIRMAGDFRRTNVDDGLPRLWFCGGDGAP